MSSKDGGADLEIVKQFHDEAYIHVEQGLSLEESGQPVAAMASYEKGLRLLEQGLSPACDMPHCIGEKWDNARLLQMKMRKTKSEVLARLESLSKERGGMTCPAYEPRPQEMPPSYEEACGGGGSSNFGQGIESPTSTFGAENKNGFKSYQDLLNGMEMTDVENVTAFSEMSGGELQNIFTIADGVQIFFILPSGEVSAPCYPTALYVHRWIDANGLPLEGRNPPAFLQVGEWSFPLHPGKLPVVYTLYGAYVMPDSRAEKPGSAIGILLSEDIPEEIRQMFEHLMCELTAVRKESVSCAIQEESKLSTKISNGIVVGAEYLSKGVVYGAEVSSDYVRLAARNWRAKMTPANCPTYFDPRVQRGFQIAKDVSQVAARFSGFLVSQLGRATMAVGQQLAPHVRTQATRLISKATGEDEPDKANATIDSFCEVAYGGLKGFSTVYLGLEQAASVLAKSLISETVQTVDYRYGSQASDATQNTLVTVGNLAMTTHNINNMGVKAIVKSTAKATGKAVVMEYEESKVSFNKEGDLKNGNVCKENGETSENPTFKQASPK